MSTLVLPRILESGPGSLSRLGSVAGQAGISRALVITDATMIQLGYVERALSALREAGVAAAVFDGTEPEPTETSIIAGLDCLKSGIDGAEFDGLIAVGGGSAIDSAKALSILAVHGGRMRDYKVPRIVDEPGLPVIAVPTTAGTGSAPSSSWPASGHLISILDSILFFFFIETMAIRGKSKQAATHS